MKPTEFQMLTETKLNRIAWLSSRDDDKVFDNLMHLFNKESLRGCFSELDGRKAVGIDGIDKDAYGAELDRNLEDLLERMKRWLIGPDPCVRC